MSTEERAVEALQHLQVAALEMIAAARSTLDIAEELVRDPAVLVAAAKAMTPRPTTQDADDVPGATPRVQHIRVS